MVSRWSHGGTEANNLGLCLWRKTNSDIASEEEYTRLRSKRLKSHDQSKTRRGARERVVNQKKAMGL
jgi:hypothetical protein